MTTLQWSDCDFKRLKVHLLKKSGDKEESREILKSNRLYNAFAKMVEKRGREVKG